MKTYLATLSLLFVLLTLPSSGQVTVYSASTYKPEPDPHGETCPYEGGECSYLASTNVDSYQRVAGVLTEVRLYVNGGQYYNNTTNAFIAPFSRSSSTLELLAFTIPGSMVGQVNPVNVQTGSYAYDHATGIITIPQSGFAP